MNDLIRRCAAFGWTLRPVENGYELLGCGAPSLFGRLEALDDWLSHQEHASKRPVKAAEYEQLSLLEEVA